MAIKRYARAVEVKLCKRDETDPNQLIWRTYRNVRDFHSQSEGQTCYVSFEYKQDETWKYFSGFAVEVDAIPYAEGVES